MTIAVTGSTGALGQLVAAHLAYRGLPQRLVVRSPERAPRLAGAEVTPFGGYADRAGAVAALAGVRVLFMVSAAEAPDRLQQHFAFVDAASAAGVEHVVYTSFFKASADSTFTLGRDHFATEQRIRASGMGFTFLRDNFYLDVLPHFVGEDGVLRGPGGDGRVAAVSRADVARVAAQVIVAPTDHAGATYDLTGPDELTLTEVAATIEDVTGRPTGYHAETVDEAYASRRRWPAEQWQYDAWVSTYTSIAAGEMVPATDAVERLTGRRPLSLRELLESAVS